MYGCAWLGKCPRDPIQNPLVWSAYSLTGERKSWLKSYFSNHTTQVSTNSHLPGDDHRGYFSQFKNKNKKNHSNFLNPEKSTNFVLCPANSWSLGIIMVFVLSFYSVHKWQERKMPGESEIQSCKLAQDSQLFRRHVESLSCVKYFIKSYLASLKIKSLKKN